MTTVLIIGLGRAGKRHAKIAQSMGLTVGIVDPRIVKPQEIEEIFGNEYPPVFDNLKSALADNVWECAVICTPPNQHIAQIKACLDRDMYVMCEKPLCDLGQLEQAEELLEHPFASRVMVTYNYRYNPDIMKSISAMRSEKYLLLAKQYRKDLPEWGLLLDHVPHDVDILRFISMEELVITNANYEEDENYQRWEIEGITYESKTPFGISEEVVFYPHARTALIVTPHGTVEMTANPEMFTIMWYEFLEKAQRSMKQSPGLKNAFQTQQVIEDVYRIYNAREKS